MHTFLTIAALLAQAGKQDEYTPPDFGIKNAEHASQCYLGGGEITLDLQKLYRTRRAKYFFDYKGAVEALVEGFRCCASCLGR